MMRTLAGLSFAVFLSAAAFAQAPAASPTFDATDVHPHPKSNAVTQTTGGVIRGGRYDLRGATMLELVRTAYNLEPDFIAGGPSWLERDRFDIAAKAPQATSQENIRLMLQALLADRFKLVVHKDSRPIAGFGLTVSKGKHKLRETEGKGFGCQGKNQMPDSGVPTVIVECKNMTMEALAPFLKNAGQGSITGPVMDATGLKGAWDFELKFTPRQLLQRAGADGIDFLVAVEQQLGLKLEPQKVPQPVLVVDSVNIQPTANLPDIAALIPPSPVAEFDVAELKLSPPDAGTNIRLQPGGRIDAQGVTLKMLITVAWDINDDELIANLPKFADETKFSLVARASSAMSGTATQPQVDIDDLRMMVRALLKERFKLATHMEDRPVTAWTMTADKPKLQKADPANRTSFKEGPGPDGKDPRVGSTTLTRLVSFSNFTMAQLAEDLPRMANGYFRTPVLDATGLTGSYDFTLSFSPIGILNGQVGRGAGGNAAGGADPSANDPSGGLSVFDAINKQLGLKIEKVKRPLPVLVIDHVEEKPIDN